jgi:hypothetical protein
VTATISSQGVATSQGRVPAADLRADDATMAQTLAPILSYLPPGIPAPLVQRAHGLDRPVRHRLLRALRPAPPGRRRGPADREAFFATCIRHWTARSPDGTKIFRSHGPPARPG